MKSLRGYKTECRKICRPAYVTRETSMMHAASESQDRTKLVIWYDWRRRPFPGGCTRSSIVPGLDLGGSSRSYQMSPTEYRVKKLLPCGQGVRRDGLCTLTVSNRTTRDPFNFSHHWTMLRRTETCLQIQMLESMLS